MPLEEYRPVGDPTEEGCGPVADGHPVAATGPLPRRIVETVRAEGRIARVDLAKRLDVSPATITSVVTDLIARGLLREVEGPVRQGSRGRPPTALGIVPAAAHVIGLKLSEFRHSGVLMDFAGRVVAEAALDRAEPARDLDRLAEEAATLVDRLLKQAGRTAGDVLNIGAGLPGFVDHDGGTLAWSPLLPVGRHDLAGPLSRRLGRPVRIDNDANLLTLAELWFGHGRRVPDFAVVTIEQGIGMGLAIGHRLYRGAGAMGMELGHTKVQLDGALCRCGQRGCLEAYVSDYALVREASTALDLSVRASQSAQVILDSLHDQAKAGNEAARTIFRRAGRFMALGLANVYNLFDPSLIVVSGARLRYDYLYAEEVFSEMRTLIIDSGRPPPRIEVNAWGEFGWARGAAAMALAEATDALFAGESA
ncbi:ROK family protein [Rhodobacterales bacterium HKCCE3408]|nr:ROK family protein [Rhodobacterales bacterium HKCCE3408]